MHYINTVYEQGCFRERERKRLRLKGTEALLRFTNKTDKKMKGKLFISSEREGSADEEEEI